MLQPKRVKYRRPHIIKYEGHCKSAPKVAFGEFGLQALEGTWVTTRQIEAARIVLARYTKRGGQIWIRIFPHLAKTKSQLKSEWVLVKVVQKIGSQSSVRVVSCLKSPVSRKKT